jgi:hypothetical protein
MATFSLRFLAHRVGQAFADRRVRRLLAKAPRFALGQLPEDTLGRISGIARPLDKRVIEAPLSGRHCFYYSIEIDGLRAKTYRILGGYQEAIAFVLEDRDDRAIIDPLAAQVSCAFDHVVRVTTRERPTERALEILARRGIVEGNLRFFSELRVREAIVEIDEAISVLGSGTREPDHDVPGGYRDRTATRLYMAGSRRFPLVISDDPRSM